MRTSTSAGNCSAVRALTGAIKAILVDDEGLDEDATTYHEAAILALTELVIDTQDLSTWQRI